jgi:hypothetical protein
VAEELGAEVGTSSGADADAVISGGGTTGSGTVVDGASSGDTTVCDATVGVASAGCGNRRWIANPAAKAAMAATPVPTQIRRRLGGGSDSDTSSGGGVSSDRRASGSGSTADNESGLGRVGISWRYESTCSTCSCETLARE